MKYSIEHMPNEWNSFWVTIKIQKYTIYIKLFLFNVRAFYSIWDTDNYGTHGYMNVFRIIKEIYKLKNKHK